MTLNVLEAGFYRTTKVKHFSGDMGVIVNHGNFHIVWSK